MYNIIQSIINHSYNTQYGGDQQYIYFISGALIIVSFVVLLDMVYNFIFGIIHK